MWLHAAGLYVLGVVAQQLCPCLPGIGRQPKVGMLGWACAACCLFLWLPMLLEK